MTTFGIIMVIALWCCAIIHRFAFGSEYKTNTVIRWHVRLEFILLCILTTMLIFNWAGIIKI